MAEKQLATVVYVDGKAYGPGRVSARIAKKITNPKAWVDVEPGQTPAPSKDETCPSECAQINHPGVEHEQYVEESETPDVVDA